MVGLGETDEVVELMKDLRRVSCDIMTIGQYLQPHAPPAGGALRHAGELTLADRWHGNGHKHVESSPLTRSSYHARQQTDDAVVEAASCAAHRIRTLTGLTPIKIRTTLR